MKAQKMNIVSVILFNTTFSKWFFTLLYGTTTIALLQDAAVNHQGFFESLLNNVPAQVLYVLGIIYAITLIFRNLSKAWKDHKINMLEIKIKQQELNQEIIHTEKDDKELNEI